MGLGYPIFIHWEGSLCKSAVGDESDSAGRSIFILAQGPKFHPHFHKLAEENQSSLKTHTHTQECMLNKLNTTYKNYKSSSVSLLIWVMIKSSLCMETRNLDASMLP